MQMALWGDPNPFPFEPKSAPPFGGAFCFGSASARISMSLASKNGVLFDAMMVFCLVIGVVFSHFGNFDKLLMKQKLNGVVQLFLCTDPI